MRKRTFWVAAIGCAAVLVAGGLFASNMGFKLNYALDGPATNGSATGTSSIAVPYNQQTNLLDAEDLINDINAAGGAGSVGSISQYVRSTDGLLSYTGFSGTNFALVPSEAYFVQVNNDVNYIIVGSHDPGLDVVLDGPATNGSATGTNFYAYPYHSTAAFAEDLIIEINAAGGAGSVGSVSQFVKTSDGLLSYTGFSGTNFALVPGEGYLIQVNNDVTFKPSHY